MDEWDITIRNDVLGTERHVTGNSDTVLNAYARRLNMLWECQAQRLTFLSNLTDITHALDFETIRVLSPLDEPPKRPKSPVYPQDFAQLPRQSKPFIRTDVIVAFIVVTLLLFCSALPLFNYAKSYLEQKALYIFAPDKRFLFIFILLLVYSLTAFSVLKMSRIIRRRKRYSRALSEYGNRFTEWQQAFGEYETEVKAKQRQHEEYYDRLRDEWHQKSQEGVETYCEFVLIHNGTDLDSTEDQKFHYDEISRILTLDLSLIGPGEMSADYFRIRDVQFIKTRNEWKELFYSTAEAGRIYDDIIYKLVLRNLYILFDADTVGALDAIILNGYVDATDKATGHKVRNCILSVEAKRDEFMALNLASVDSKACFRRLKGIGSPQLHTLTPVAPMARIEGDDVRFVNGKEVVDGLDDATNLAAMDWEDFEHLVREIFEKEFTRNGGEVRVTRASRDGGVDAIAFDPDPLRGGKIVIQAKRYTNTVGVNAVRDLYGTLINEGATKGILVTTSDYGPDAYEFAKGKPLTLLNGANLLHLLAKHGHRARINLNEAKQVLKQGEGSPQPELWQ